MSFREFLAILEDFDDAMLVTRRGEALRSRPMLIAESTDTGRLWFLSSATSGKLEELAVHPEVNVALQDGGSFLSISGTAQVVRDGDKAQQLWSEAQRPWFPCGPEDPNLILIEVTPQVAEYWDRSGLGGVRFLLAEAAAVVGGQTLTDNAGTHGRVTFD
jgi:general stress protein 26